MDVYDVSSVFRQVGSNPRDDERLAQITYSPAWPFGQFTFSDALVQVLDNHARAGCGKLPYDLTIDTYCIEN